MESIDTDAGRAWKWPPRQAGGVAEGGKASRDATRMADRVAKILLWQMMQDDSASPETLFRQASPKLRGIVRSRADQLVAMLAARGVSLVDSGDDAAGDG